MKIRCSTMPRRWKSKKINHRGTEPRSHEEEKRASCPLRAFVPSCLRGRRALAACMRRPEAYPFVIQEEDRVMHRRIVHVLLFALSFLLTNVARSDDHVVIIAIDGFPAYVLN